MRKVFVTGAAMTPFSHHWDTPLERLGAEAIIGALNDAELGRAHIEAAYASHMSQGEGGGQRILRELDFPPITVVNVENACAGGGTALREAWLAIAAGVADTALVIGVEKLVKTGLLSTRHRPYSQMLGQTVPGSYALSAQRHMADYGTTREQIAGVAVKNRNNGVHNPFAMFRKPCTLDDVLQSRPIADPLTLLQCCAPASGAAAVVLTSARLAARRRSPRPVRVLWSEVVGDLNRGVPEDYTRFEATATAAARAYERSGVAPADVDVVELHEAFSVAELVHYEALGLCPRGEAGRLIDDQATAIGGRIPVNPSGGLLARGHPTGATGVAQIVELVWQIRGAAGARQVEGARVGLAQCQGGIGRGTGAAVVSLVLA